MGTPTTRKRLVAAWLLPPLVLAVAAGPLAGAASADRPTTVTSSIAGVPGSAQVLKFEAADGVTTLTFREQTVDVGVFSGTSTNTWTCIIRERKDTFRCTGEGQFMGTYQGVTGLADTKLLATCSETESTPPVVTCTGRYHLDGKDALEGLRGHGTFQSSGVFNVSVRGTSEMRLHDHR